MIKLKDLKNVQISDIDISDYPDFCNAFIEYAEYADGTEVPEEVLEELLSEVNEYIFDHDLYINDYEFDMER